MQLEGTVENIVFQSDDNGFCVFKLSSKEFGYTTVVLNSFPPFLGQEIALSGQWTTHPRFGQQFKATSYKSFGMQTSTVAIERFLASGMIKGVGKSMAARIVATFGLDTLDVLDNNPSRLTQVSGIAAKKAQVIAEAYSELSQIRELMLFLETKGISSAYAPKLQAVYGLAAVELIEQNPYRLCSEVDGIGFKIADKIAIGLGFALDDDKRIVAALEYCLQQIAQTGHICVPREFLTEQTARLLLLDELVISQVLQALLDDDKLYCEFIDGNYLIYPKYLYLAEIGVAQKLLELKDNARALLSVDVDKIVSQWELSENIRLAKVQKEAIDSGMQHGVLVVTGGPGTGKTTIVKGLLRVLEAAGCQILLCAPTGRAARRLAETSGRQAFTVHKMLEYSPHEGLFAFGRNEDNLLDADVIIVDEASMLDIVLTNYLLKAVALGARVIFVGDVDQLPAVGPGSVLKDIIKSDRVPVVRLNEIFRQEQQSKIIINAHLVNKGRLPELDRQEEFAFVETSDDQEVAEKIVQLYDEFYQKNGVQVVQVLSPMYKLACGVENLNKMLQDKINPADFSKSEIVTVRQVLREGDKVMQMRNNYEKEVFNGDIGWVREAQGRMLRVFFPDVGEGLTVSYEQGELDQLQLAYAISVHKSQGSEYPVVILALSRGHYVFLQRNLFYTAITRASVKTIVVGQKKAMQTAVLNDKMRQRYSLLSQRLQEGVLC